MNSVVDEVKWNIVSFEQGRTYKWNDLIRWITFTSLHEVHSAWFGLSGLGNTLEEAIDDCKDFLRILLTDKEPQTLEGLARANPNRNWFKLTYAEGKIITNVEKFDGDDNLWKFYFHDGSTATLSVTINVDVKRQEPLC